MDASVSSLAEKRAEKDDRRRRIAEARAMTHDPFVQAEKRAQAEIELSVLQRQESIRGLRALADLLEQNPSLPVPDLTAVAWSIDWGGQDDDAERLAEFARTLPGRVEKEVSNSLFELHARLAEGVTYTIRAMRDAVCNRRQVGTKTVQREVPVETRTEVTQEPVYEWDCQPVLRGTFAGTEDEVAGQPDPPAEGPEHH